MRSLLAIAAMFLSGCSYGETVFSSRSSPDGSLVAESVTIGDGEAGGRLVIRAKDGSERHVDFAETAPDLFMLWRDDRHLEVWSERQAVDLKGADRVGEVNVVARSYDFPTDGATAYSRPGVPSRTVAVPAGEVVATFSWRPYENGNGRFCVLTLGTAADPSVDAASVEIEAGVTTSCKPRPCSGIATRFTLADRRASGRQTMLTSASISDIPSANRLPTGDGGTSVRGQFLEQSAASLIEALKKPSVVLDFSRDFFDQVVKYDLPLWGVATPVNDFAQCVGDADMLWMLHRP